ncbi:MAG: AraC family transcriptional regulator [Clostridiales bacterium]|nr:AraC family transcriptional regulator [Clostridiales bacterium]
MNEILYDAGETEMINPSNEQFQLHNHDEYELYMFLEGNSTYVVEEKSYSLLPDDMIVIRKQEMHRVFHNGPAKYRRIVLSVSPSFFGKYGCAEYENAFCSNNSGNKISSKLVRSSGLYDAVMRLKKYSDNFSVLHTAIADSIMIEILYLINKISLFETADRINLPIKNVINYINNNFTGEIKLDMLCSRFYISKYHLCRIFKEATGLTVQGYIRQKRLTLANELLREGKSLTDAAMLAGFGDYSSFYRAYVKRCGKNPRSYASVTENR